MSEKMLDSKIVELSSSFAYFNEYIEDINTIDGQTFDLIKEALTLESSAYTDSNCIDIIEDIIENYHIWHRIDAGESESTKVVIEVLGGVAYLVSAPNGVEVEIRDLDSQEGESK
jgi:hypothetical protein